MKDKNKAIQMYKQGHSVRSICYTIGYTEPAFYAMMRREGVPTRKAQGPSPEVIYLAKYLDITEAEAGKLFAARNPKNSTIDTKTLARAKIRLKHVADLPLPEGYGLILFPFPVIVTPDDQIPLTWLDILCLFKAPEKWIKENIKC